MRPLPVCICLLLCVGISVMAQPASFRFGRSHSQHKSSHHQTSSHHNSNKGHHGRGPFGSVLSSLGNKAMALAPRKMDVDRQGGVLSTILGAPFALGLLGMLMNPSVLLPTLLLGPLALNALSGSSGSGSGSSGIGGNLGGQIGQVVSSLLGSSSSGSNGPPQLPNIANPVAAASSNVPKPVPPPSPPSTGTLGLPSGGSASAQQAFTDVLMNALSSPGSSHSGGSGSSSGDDADSLLSMASNTITRISNYLFSNRNSNQASGANPNKPGGDGLFDSRRNGIISTLMDVYSVLSTGLRRYEIAEPECQARLVCEVNQKAIGRSLGGFTATLLDLIGVESRLERSTRFGSETKSILKEYVRAARAGMQDTDCSIVYSRCPSNIAVEPLRASFLGSLFGKKGAGGKHPQGLQSGQTPLGLQLQALPMQSQMQQHMQNQMHQQQQQQMLAQLGSIPNEQNLAYVHQQLSNLYSKPNHQAQMREGNSYSVPVKASMSHVSGSQASAPSASSSSSNSSPSASSASSAPAAAAPSSSSASSSATPAKYYTQEQLQKLVQHSQQQQHQASAQQSNNNNMKL